MTYRGLAACVVVTGVIAGCLLMIGLAGAQASDRAWLALGDSYSSGEGIPGTVDVKAAKKYQGRNCQRATGEKTDATAWAVSAYRAVARDLSIGSIDFVACTGALTSELASQIGEAQTRSGRRTWDVVTLSAGGNDIGFADVLLGCLDANGLPWGAFDLTPGCDADQTDLRSQVDKLRNTLGPVYDLIASKVALGGDVVVAGYPHLVEETARWDRWRRGATGNCEGIQSYDVGMLRSVTGYLNEQIAAAVADADTRHRGTGVRFHFLDISRDPYEYSGDPGTRHALCSRDPWLNGQTTGASAGDYRLDRSFHPTQVGHDNTGRVLATLLRESVAFDDIPTLKWSRAGLIGLPWGTDRRMVITRITEALGRGPDDELEVGGECGPVTGSRVFWRDEFVVLSLDLAGRLGGVSLDPAVIPHSGGIDVGDTFGALQAAEPAATWAGPLTAPGSGAEDYYEWTIDVGDTMIRGGLTGPPPSGVIENYVHMSGPFDPPACGE